MPVKIHLSINKSYSWQNIENVYAKGFAFTAENKILHSKDLAEYFIRENRIENIRVLTEKLNGIFSVVLNCNAKVFIITDTQRCFPIFYRQTNDEIFISDNCYEFIAVSNLNQEALKIFKSTGFVVGNETILQNIYQVEAGSIVSISNKNIECQFYHIFKKEESKTPSNPKIIFENIGKRLVTALAGKTAVIPLSGGYDSRLILSILKNQGYKNVICYSYGIKGNQEAKTSKRVAESLGFPWKFVNYNKELIQGFSTKESFENHCRFASNCVSSFFTQDFFAVDFLKSENLIPEDSVFIPGHSGDTLSGKPFENYNPKKSIAKNIFDFHYKINNPNFSDFESSILKQLQPISDEDNFINFNLKERQSKFTVNSVRTYEFFGYKFLLPLLDKDFIHYFQQLSFEEKLHQKNYINFIFEEYFIPYQIDFKKKKTKGFKRKIIGGYNRIKRALATDDLNFKAIAKDYKKSFPLKTKWNSTKLNINEIQIEWYLELLQKDLSAIKTKAESK